MSPCSTWALWASEDDATEDAVRPCNTWVGRSSSVAPDHFDMPGRMLTAHLFGTPVQSRRPEDVTTLDGIVAIVWRPYSMAA